MELNLKQRIFYFFPVLFCFCMPFGSLALSGIIILFTISSFFNLEKESLRKGFMNPLLLLLYLFFIITCISALFSANSADALFNIEVKLSFILFPYLIFCFKWPVEVVKKCLVSFVSGCFFSALILIIRAAVYAYNGQPEYFFYTSFSNFIHASYFAMYLILAITIITLYYPIWFKEHKQFKYVSVFFVLLFILTIFLCSSKLGMISFFICLPLLILHKFKSLFNLKRAVLLFAALILLVFVLSKMFPEPFQRLNSITAINTQTLDKTSGESTTVRILIWEQCLQIIWNNFLTGVGIGDVNDTLFEAYKQNGMTGALNLRLNTHNQFFQTFIGLGISGFILLLVLTLGQMIVGIIKKNFILTLTMLLIVLNFLVESMLQTSAGTLFYVFFLCLFSLPKINNELKN